MPEMLGRLGGRNENATLRQESLPPLNVDARDRLAVKVKSSRSGSGRPRICWDSRGMPAGTINIDTNRRAIAPLNGLWSHAAPFDRWVEGDEGAIWIRPKRGLRAVRGQGKCFTCTAGGALPKYILNIGPTTTDRGRGPVAEG